MTLIDGLPLHPLVVHAPVVLLPLTLLGTVVFLVRPGTRRALGPWLVTTAVIAALSAIASVWSGEQLAEGLGLGDELDRHESLGELTRMWAVVVAAGAILLVAYDRRGGRRPVVVTSAAVVLAAIGLVAVTMVGLAGHAGARLVWEDTMVAAGNETARATPDTSDVPGSGEQAPVRDDTSRVVDVVLGEWDLTTSADELPPGRVTFRFRNVGVLPHALRIRSDGDGDRLEWRSERVPPGASGELTVELPVGVYELDCPVESSHGEHDALGMERVLVVHPEAPPPASTSDGVIEPATPVVDPGVTIEGFDYVPSEIRVPAGTEVVWTNRDRARHTATGSGWDTGVLSDRASGSVRFDAVGRHEYACTLHPGMVGVVEVTPQRPVSDG